MGTSCSSSKCGDGDELQQGPFWAAREDCAEGLTGRTCHFHGDILVKLYDQQYRGLLCCCCVCPEASPAVVTCKMSRFCTKNDFLPNSLGLHLSQCR